MYKKKKDMDNLISVGDVITSPKFAFGEYEIGNRESITIRDEAHVRYCLKQNSSIDARKMKKNQIRAVKHPCSYDRSRATAKFVVEVTTTEGGGTCHGGGDVYFDACYVQARRLKEDGSYNPSGDIIRFYTGGSFNCVVKPEHITILKKMKMIFV